MSTRSVENLVLDVLVRAISQRVDELKTAETQLAEWENEPGFYTILMRIISNLSIDPCVRFMAAVTFKNGVDRYWRKSVTNILSEEEKADLRVGLMVAFKEPVNQVALQLAVVIAKVSRSDYPREWPELIPSILLVARGSDTLAQHRAFLTLHHVIKTLASKRLTGDRRQFQILAADLYPFVLEFNNAIMESFFVLIQSNDPQCQDALEKALLSLRILRFLTIDGFKEPKSSPEVVMFLSSVFDRAKNMLQIRRRLENNTVLLKFVEKVIVNLTKIVLLLLEDHPHSFVPFIAPSLSFSVSLLFTQEGEGLLFERFVVQCLNLVKGILVCPEYKLSKSNRIEDSPNMIATRFKNEFFQTNVLNEVCRKLITHYLLLTGDELQKWDADPEEFENEDGTESWKYNLRPSSECVFKALFREFRDILSPVLVDLVYTHHQLVNPHDLQAVLLKDAVYLAAGLAAFELYDDIDFDKWFLTLQQELTIKDANYRIIRRRAAWLVGEWSGVKLSAELRPALYRSLIPLLQADEDFVVRLTAARTIKVAIDNFGFEPDDFMEFLEPTFGLLFNLLKESKECETKMHVLTVLSFIVERMGESIRPYSASLIQYLPLLWNQSENHMMLRCAIVCTLVQFVKALVADDLTAFLYPIIEVCVDLKQEPHVYLMEDGLELWYTMLVNSKSLSPPMLLLTGQMPAILDEKMEYLQSCCLILKAYILLAPQVFMSEHGKDVFQCCNNLLRELNPEGVLTIFLLIETAIRVDAAAAIDLTMSSLQDVFLRVHNGKEYSTMLISCELSLVARIILHSTQIFCQIIEWLSIHKGETPEASLEAILSTWIAKMALVTHKDKRKLLALAISSLLSIRSQAVMNQIAGIIQNVVAAMNDVVDTDDNNVHADSLLLDREEEFPDDDYGMHVTENTRRLQLLSDRDPVYNVALHTFFEAQMKEFKNQIGVEAMNNILWCLPEECLTELRTYITI